MRTTVLQRFLVSISDRSKDECWEWQAAVFPTTGYGACWYGGRVTTAHRAVYEIMREPIPKGLHIDHLCRNRRCCNPWHMETVTCRTNIHRGLSPTAVHVNVTHCPSGHPYDEANTSYSPQGWRRCRACWNAYDAKHRAKRARSGRERYHRNKQK